MSGEVKHLHIDDVDRAILAGGDRGVAINDLPAIGRQCAGAAALRRQLDAALDDEDERRPGVAWERGLFATGEPGAIELVIVGAGRE